MVDFLSHIFFKRKVKNGSSTFLGYIVMRIVIHVSGNILYRRNFANTHPYYFPLKQ